MKFRPFFLIFVTAIFAFSAPAQGAVNPNQFSASVGSRIGAVSTGTGTGSISAAAVRSLEKDAFELINTERALVGLPGLKWSDKVADVARLHSNNMAEFDFFSHRGLDGLMVDERAEKLHMGAWSAIGENIAFMKGYDHPVQTAVEKWLQSPGHKKNLLGDQWTETAIGLAVTADGKYYFTQVFIKN